LSSGGESRKRRRRVVRQSLWDLWLIRSRIKERVALGMTSRSQFGVAMWLLVPSPTSRLCEEQRPCLAKCCAAGKFHLRHDDFDKLKR
jgi:hypothetical protein